MCSVITLPGNRPSNMPTACLCHTAAYTVVSNSIASVIKPEVHSGKLCHSETEKQTAASLQDFLSLWSPALSSNFANSCGGPLAFHYANLMAHTAYRQSLACVSYFINFANSCKPANCGPHCVPASRLAADSTHTVGY
jgi:hypothetical protein